jgi:hypothetical protein
MLRFILTPWSRVLENLTVTQLVKKFPAFYGTWRFITVFIQAHPSLEPYESSSHLPVYSSKIYTNIIFPFMPRSCRCSLHQVFKLKFCMHFLSPMHAIWSTYIILLDFICLFFEEYKSWSLSLCNFLQPPPSSQNICLSTLFSNTLNLCPSLNMKWPSVTSRRQKFLNWMVATISWI